MEVFEITEVDKNPIATEDKLCLVSCSNLKNSSSDLSHYFLSRDQVAELVKKGETEKQLKRGIKIKLMIRKSDFLSKLANLLE